MAWHDAICRLEEATLPQFPESTSKGASMPRLNTSFYLGLMWMVSGIMFTSASKPTSKTRWCADEETIWTYRVTLKSLKALKRKTQYKLFSASFTQQQPTSTRCEVEADADMRSVLLSCLCVKYQPWKLALGLQRLLFITPVSWSA